METTNFSNFEQRFQSPDALAAARRLIDRALASGLKARLPNSVVNAIEFDDEQGRAPFSVIANQHHALVYLRQPALTKFPGVFEKATQIFGPVKPNQKGEYRWRVESESEIDRILDWLWSEGVWPWRADGSMPPTWRDGRLPAAVLDRVTTAHILEAARDLASGFGDHDFSEATQYEVIFENQRLKPKALFGVAATRALGFRVMPAHFSGGLGTQSFRKITEAGLPIVSVGTAAPPAKLAPSRGTETTKFDVGKPYAREQVAERIGMPQERRGGNWDTGYDSFNGEYFIFCNIGVAGRTGHDYANRWHDNRLIWYAKSRSRLGQPQIEQLLSGQMPVHMFWRGKDRAAFTYAGLAVAESVQDTSPVEVTWLLDSPASQVPDAVAQPLWRRGPPPAMGERNLYLQDGPTSVYVMVLDGSSPATFPTISVGGKLAKIGMSNDPTRRLVELNCGFPPGCVLRWAFVRAREYPSGHAAYEAEGSLLEQFRAAGKWVANEFVSVTEDELDELLC